MPTELSEDRITPRSKQRDKVPRPRWLQYGSHVFRERAIVGLRDGNGRKRPKDKETLAIMHLPVLRRSLLVRLRQVSWLGGCSCKPHSRFAFPSSIARVALQSSFPRSQWRNRAGSSPDFPFAPARAPETVFVIPHHQTAYCQRYVSKSPLIRQNFLLARRTAQTTSRSPQICCWRRRSKI
jgi:hypothetical protein